MTAEQSLSLSDVVPQFRVDLKVSEPTQGAGEQTITVQDPNTGMSIGLRGFEMSIARMLNGQRTVAQVIEVAEGIGLPLSVDSLSSFVRKLRTLGWLVEAGAPLPPKAEGSMWEPRAEWSEDVRRKYQVALKEARADRFNEAQSALQQLLAAQPELKEATQLLEWVQHKLSATKAGGRMPTFTDVYVEVERGWFAEGERMSEMNSKPPEENISLPRSTGAARAVLLVGVVVVLVIAGLLVPLPYQAKASYELFPHAITQMVVQRTGQLLKVQVADGQAVEQGAVLATYDSAGAKTQLQEVEGKLAAAQKKLTAASAPNKKAAEAKKKLDKASAEEKKAAAALEKEKTKAKGKKTPALAKAEKKAAAAEAETAKEKKALDAASANPAKDAAEKEVAALTTLRDTAKTQVDAPPLTASAAGTVSALAVKDGAQVQAGTPFCKLEDTHTLRAKLTPKDGDKLKEGQSATLTVEGKPVAAKVEKLVGKEAEATLDNAKGAYKSGAKGEATVDVGGRSVLNRL